jgi:hypothetical protein
MKQMLSQRLSFLYALCELQRMCNRVRSSEIVCTDEI